MLYVLYKSITIQSNYQLQCTYYTIYNEYCKLISSPQVKLAYYYLPQKQTHSHTHKLHFSNLCCITVADIHSILYCICMYIFYIYVRVLILMLKKKRNNEKYEFIRLFRITLVYYYYIFLLITSMYYLSSTLCIYLYLYELPKSSGVL